MKSFILLFLPVLCTTALFAQDVRFNVYGNYVFDDKVQSYNTSTDYFEGTIRGGFLWGAGVELRLHDYYGVELLYLRQNTTAPLHYYDINSFADKSVTANMNLNWIMAGGTRALAPGKKIEPYAGCLVGMAIINADNPEAGTSAKAVKFAWGLRLGSNFWLTDKIAIKVQTALLSAVQAAGSGLYFGTGGAGATITGYSSITQFSLGGGLALQLGKGVSHKQ